MKKTTVLITLLFVAASVFAQNKGTEKADQLYHSYQFTDAIDAYSQLVENNGGNSYVYKQLGNSYYKIFNMPEASKWYKKAVAENTKDAKVYYRYAQALKTMGKYKQANIQMDEFAVLKPNDPRAKAHLRNPNYIPKLIKGNDDYKVSKMAISKPSSSDFAPILTNGGHFYFISTRNSAKKDENANLDIFVSNRSDKGKFSKPESVSSLNTRFHDGPITFSTDGKTAYLARSGPSGYYKRTKNGKVKVAQQILLKAKKTDGNWKEVEELPFNSSKYSVTHPSLSQDGKTLYFTSDMPGGQGGTDIWKVSINGNHFGKPVNLGPNVNTPGKEDFPFISDNHILYFSSTGRQGLGGLDVFKKDLSDNHPAKNMGAPINSKYDDFSYSYNKSLDVGFLASNRDGSDDIYTASPECHIRAIAIVKDGKTHKILKGASVGIADTQGNIITHKLSDSEGKVSFNVQCETEYIFHISKNGYETAMFPVKKTRKGKVEVEAELNPVEVVITDKEVKLDNIYFEFDKSNITQKAATELNKLVRVMKSRPEMKILVRAHTDAKGNAAYNKKLSQRRAQSTVQYLISQGISKDRLKGVGVGSADPKIDCQPNCSDEQRAENRRSEFLIVDSFR